MRTSCDPANRKNLPTFKCQREMSLSTAVLYKAWTEGFGTWFAVPDSVIMRTEVDTAFFFETELQRQRGRRVSGTN